MKPQWMIDRLLTAGQAGLRPDATATEERERKRAAAELQTYMTIAEFGYKACERGLNVEAMFAELRVMWTPIKLESKP